MQFDLLKKYSNRNVENFNYIGKFENLQKDQIISSATKKEFHNNNFHTKIKQTTHTTPNTTMTKLVKSLRKNMKKILSISDMSLGSKIFFDKTQSFGYYSNNAKNQDNQI